MRAPKLATVIGFTDTPGSSGRCDRVCAMQGSKRAHYRFLIIFPNGLVNSMWTDSKDQRVPMETIVINELLPHVDATFRTITSPDARLVEGVSMGGHGAARLGFKYPELFGAVSIISGGPLQQVFDVNTAPRATPATAQDLFDTVWGGDQEYYRTQRAWALAELNANALRQCAAFG